MQLTKEQVDSFHRDGFLVLSQDNGQCILSQQQIEDIKKWTQEVADWPETPGKWMKYFEKGPNNERLLQRIENFVDYHEGFSNLFNGTAFLDVLGQLLGEKAVLYKEKINMKLPGGGGFAPHQDVQAGWDMYGQTYHISVLVSIDTSTPENGCLEIVAGEHKKGLVGPMGAEIPKEVVDSMKWIPLPTKPGDLVFFDSYVPHRSGPNTTDAPRRALYLTYNKLSEGDFRARYWADKRKSFPPDCEREAGREYTYKI